MLFSASLFTISSQAQTFSRLSGTVSDPSGAMVSNAQAKLTNVGTGEIKTTKSDSTGLYVFPQVAPGVYNLQVAAEGFKSNLTTGLKIETESQARLNITLQVGTADESIVVNASNQIVETEDGSISNVVQGRQVEDMPLNGRNTMNLLGLVPGVVPESGTSGPATANSSSAGSPIGTMTLPSERVSLSGLV
jgi:hypothetical protein